MASTKKTEANAPETEATENDEFPYSAKDLAAELKVDAKAFRRWLRSFTQERANKGGRWKFSAARREELLAAWAARDKATTEAPAEATS